MVAINILYFNYSSSLIGEVSVGVGGAWSRPAGIAVYGAADRSVNYQADIACNDSPVYAIPRCGIAGDEVARSIRINTASIIRHMIAVDAIGASRHMNACPRTVIPIVITGTISN